MIFLKLGSTGPYVEMIQLALRRSGELTGNIDGIFGKETENALILFQKRNGLETDGILGKNSFDRLKKFITGYSYTTVLQGQDIKSIAEQFNTSESAILTANPRLKDNPIAVGMKIVIPLNVTLATSEIRYTSLLVSLICEGLIVRYPFINRFTYGRSVMGKSLNGLQIGNGKKQLMFNASHHANEWITTPLLLRFAEVYAKAISEGKSIDVYDAKKLFNNVNLHILPLVNPDGVDLVTGAINESEITYEQAEKLNYINIPFPSGWKANILGTDLNLNYPAGWEEARKIKFEQGFTRPAPRDYVGSFPLSAPESRAVYEQTLKNNYLMTLSYHTQGKTIYWKYADFLPKYSEEIARFFSEQSGYTYEETPASSGNAGYKDWFIKRYDRPGYTIEAGLGTNPLPLTQFNEIFKDNLGILAGALAIIANA